MRKLVIPVLTGLMAVGLTTPAFGADNRNVEPPEGVYPTTVGPHTNNEDAVRIIEKRLGQRPNGAWGPELTKALKKFQGRHDGLKKDGEVGSRTLAALRGEDKLPPRGPLTDRQAWWLGLNPRPPKPVKPTVTETASDEAVVEETAAAPAPEESYGSTETSGALDQIRGCESGGDYGAVDPSGTYGGAYQFDQSTWQSVGGSGDPASASPAEQDMRAQTLLEQSGTSPWPTCGG